MPYYFIFHLVVASTAATAAVLFLFLFFRTVRCRFCVNAHAVELMHTTYRAFVSLHVCFGTFQHLDLQKKICLIIDGMRTLLRDFHTHFFLLLFTLLLFLVKQKSIIIIHDFFVLLVQNLLLRLMDMKSKNRELK